MRWLREALRKRSGPAPREAGEGVAFLVSSPRSGSTWTKRALNQHPQVFCTEQRLFGGFAQFWTDDVATGRASLRITLDAYVSALATPFDYPALGIPREEFERDALGVVADALFRYGRERSGKRVVVDKITPYPGSSVRVLRAIREHFPAARLLFLLRDARDVATSGVYDWLGKATSDRPLTEFQERRRRRLVLREGPPLERFFEPFELDSWALQWRDPLEAIAPEAELLVTYEGMKRDQRGELGRLLRALGVRADEEALDACVSGSSFERMSGGRAAGEAVANSGIRKGVVGDWRSHFTRADGARFHALVGDLLLAHGYESDPLWHRELPELLAL